MSWSPSCLVVAGATFLTMAACASDDGVGKPPPLAIEVPAACASRPSFAEAQARAAATLGAKLGEPLVPLRSMQIPPVSVASALGNSELYEKEIAVIVSEGESFADILEHYDLEVDFATESLLVVSYWPNESTLDLRRDGSVAHAFVARAQPCLDAETTQATSSRQEQVLVAAIPKTLTTAEMHAVGETFRPVLPTSTDGCKREGAVFSGGGSAGVLAGSPNMLFINGFSAMTGNVFESLSADAVSWAPSGWDEGHLLSFDERGPYADVYSPTPVRLGGALFLYATDRPLGQQGRIGRFALADGARRFGAVEPVLSPASSGWDDGFVGSPSVLERGGTVQMYYTGNASQSDLARIGLATSTDGGKTFAREASNPVVRPEMFSYGVSSVADPEVREVDGHLDMWCTRVRTAR